MLKKIKLGLETQGRQTAYKLRTQTKNENGHVN